MTLFRKVFLNQSRAATPGEALDENALRDAFREMPTSNEPLVLDPFARVNQSVARVSASPEQALEEPLHDSVAEDLTEDETEEVRVSYFREEEEDTETTVAGISAALQRAEVEPSAVDEEEHEDETDTLDTWDEEETPQEEAITVDAFDDAQVSPHDAPEVAQAETFDLAAFAQRQLQALDPAKTAPPVAEHGAWREPEEVSAEALPAPAAGRAGRRAGRVKTRLLGFNRADVEESDPFGTAAETTATAQREKFPVGWLVVVEGPGIGHSFSLFTGASMIGRGEDQVIRLDFGDNSISRQNHAAIAYDEEQNKFYLGHGGKSNIIRRNARPVLSTEELHHADLIRIGETTLRFVALCGSDFQWHMMDGSNAAGL